MQHEMRLVDFAFNAIKNNIKDIEIRLNDEKRRKINIGDTIIFTNIDTSATLKVEVINLYKYDTFEKLFNNFDIKRFGLSENDNYKIMYNFYTLEEEKKYDALGIEIKVI